MYRRLVPFLLLVVAAPATAGPLPDGRYLISYFASGGFGQTMGIVTIKDGAGSLTGSIPMVKSEIKDFTMKNDMVSFKLILRGSITLEFNGKIDAKEGKIARGMFGDSDRSFRATFTPTEKETLEQADLRAVSKIPEGMKAYTKLVAAVRTKQAAVRRESDADKKLELTEELEAAKKELAAKAPAILDEIIQGDPSEDGVYEAAMARIDSADETTERKAIEAVVKAVGKNAALYGPKYEAMARMELADKLAKKPMFAAIGLGIVEQIVAELPANATTTEQVRVFKTLRNMQTAAGKNDAAAATFAKLEKLETKLDEEYVQKVPPFKPTQYKGEKRGTQTVVMELFTGAQCPPCVAADVAFDALLQAYKPTDVLLLQYHMHIPGPDPLTNPTSIGRWDYYRRHSKQIGGTPTTLFNGKVEAGGGGGMSNSEKKFEQYRAVIDPMLEAKTDIKLTGKATLANGKLGVDVSVEGVKDAKDTLKVKLVLVEESVRYVGSNGVRFHHHLVRAMPGGLDGMSVNEKTAFHVDADINTIRKEIDAYLTDYAKTSTFSNSDRPLALKELKLIAILQDDQDGTILQAAQIALPH